MHIIEALMKDHEGVKELLNELINLDDSDTESRTDLIADIRDELIPHSRAEEAVFYNSLRALDPKNPKIMHGFKEHMEAESLLRTLQVKDKVNMDWRSTAKELKKALEHHIEEEEAQIFAIARMVFTQEEGMELGRIFENMKPDIKEENLIQTTFDMVKNLLPPRITDAAKEKHSSDKNPSHKHKVA